jgi:hypothetical protein
LKPRHDRRGLGKSAFAGKSARADRIRRRFGCLEFVTKELAGMAGRNGVRSLTRALMESARREGKEIMASSFEMPEGAFLPLRAVASRRPDVGDLCDEVKVSPPSVQSRNGGGGCARTTVEPDVIRILMEALDQARRGEIRAAAIVFARPNQDKCSGVSAPMRAARRYLVAACDYLNGTSSLRRTTDEPGASASRA